MDEAQIRDYYEKHPHGAPPVARLPDVRQIHDLFAARVASLMPERLLDAGCGKGLLGQRLAAFCGSYYGIDISSVALDVARGRIPRGDFRRGSVSRLPYGDGCFDCVVCAEVLEHVPDYDRAIAHLARVTRPGGRVLISTPNPLNPDLIYSLLRHGRYTPQPYERPIAHWRLARVFRREGLRVTEFFSFYHRPLFGRRMHRELHDRLMSIQQCVSQLLGVPLGLYQFFSLTKGGGA